MAPAGGPPHLINPYAGDDTEQRPSRSALAAGRAFAAGAIGIGAVALFSGTASAQELDPDTVTSEQGRPGATDSGETEVEGTGTGDQDGGEELDTGSDPTSQDGDGEPSQDGTGGGPEELTGEQEQSEDVPQNAEQLIAFVGEDNPSGGSEDGSGEERSTDGDPMQFGPNEAPYETALVEEGEPNGDASDTDGTDSPGPVLEEFTLPEEGDGGTDLSDVDFSQVEFSGGDLSGDDSVEVDFSATGSADGEVPDGDASRVDFMDIDFDEIDFTELTRSLDEAIQNGATSESIFSRIADYQIADDQNGSFRLGDVRIGEQSVDSFIESGGDDAPSAADRFEPITLSEEVRQSIDDRNRAERIEATGEFTGVPVNGDRRTVTEGALTIGSPRIDTTNADVDVDGGNISVTGIGADLGTVDVRASGRDPETGITASTNTNFVLNPQTLNASFPDEPEQTRPAGRSEPDSPPENITFATQNRFGVTTGNTRPTGDDAPTGDRSARWEGAGITIGADASGRVFNTEDGVDAQGTFSVPIRGYAGIGEDRPDGGYNVGGEATFTPYRVDFSPTRTDESSGLNAGFDARIWDGPRRNAEGQLVEPGVRAEAFLTGQYASADDRQVQVPNTTQFVETDQEQGRITLGGSLDARESVRSDTGWDVDANGRLEASGGYQFSEVETDFGSTANSGFFGNAGISGNVRAGDLEGTEQVFVEGSGRAGVQYTDQTGADFSGEARAGVGARLGDFTIGGGYTAGTEGSGPDARAGVQDVFNTPLDIEGRYQQRGDDSRVSFNAVLNGRNAPAPESTPDRPLIDFSALSDQPVEQPTFDPGADLGFADVTLGGTPTDTPPLTAAPSTDTPPPVTTPSEAPTGTAADLLGTESVGVTPAPVTESTPPPSVENTPPAAIEITPPAPAADPAPGSTPGGNGTDVSLGVVLDGGTQPEPTDPGPQLTFDDSITIDTTRTIEDFGGGVLDVNDPNLELGLMASPALDNLIAAAETPPASPVVEAPPAPVVVEAPPAPVVVEAPPAPVVVEAPPAPVVETPPAPVVPDVSSLQTDLFSSPTPDLATAELGFADTTLPAFDTSSLDSMPDLSSINASDISFTDFGGGFSFGGF